MLNKYRVDWFHLPQDRNQWQCLVNMIMTLRVQKKAWNFLNCWTTTNFSRVVINGVSYTCADGKMNLGPHYSGTHRQWFIIYHTSRNSSAFLKGSGSLTPCSVSHYICFFQQLMWMPCLVLFTLFTYALLSDIKYYPNWSFHSEFLHAYRRWDRQTDSVIYGCTSKLRTHIKCLEKIKLNGATKPHANKQRKEQ